MNCSEFAKLIDLYMDDELEPSVSAEFEAHAKECENCRKELAAAQKLKDILSHMNDDIAVPLPAQAAWRGAVRREAARRRMKRVISAAGALAAAVAITLGATAMMRTGGLQQPGDMGPVTMVATDGTSEAPTSEPQMAKMTMRSMPAAYAERPVFCEDAAEAVVYVKDIIAEYGGVIENESSDTDAVRIYVQVPTENVEDFISTVDHVGTRAEEAAFEAIDAAQSMGVCIVIIEEN